MFYVNVMNFCKGNINVYINFDTIYLATYFFRVCILETFFFSLCFTIYFYVLKFKVNGFFFKEILLCKINYIELSTRKI